MNKSYRKVYVIENNENIPLFSYLSFIAAECEWKRIKDEFPESYIIDYVPSDGDSFYISALCDTIQVTQECVAYVIESDNFPVAVYLNKNKAESAIKKFNKIYTKCNVVNYVPNAEGGIFR